MDFLNDRVEKIYRKYLVPTLGSALAMSIYSFVDTIAVGQYAGPSGSAAIAVINPIYALMVVIAFLCATGGSVRFGNAIGEGEEEKANAYFTISLILCTVITCAAWLVFSLFLPDILRYFGADSTILPYAYDYGKWIIRFFPVIVAPDFMAAFLRIDKDPKRAMAAVISGGVLNMFLDWFLVFPCGMGMHGAALATVIGTALQCGIMLSHFFTKKNHLHFVRPHKAARAIRNVLTTGAPSSLLDLGNMVMSILMNRQVLAYGGPAALGVYGVVNTVAMLVQALFSGVGQTIQPGISVNHGAGNAARVRSFFLLGVRTALIIGTAITVLGELFPNVIIRIFMSATEDVLRKAPYIMRCCFLCFPFMGYCVTAAYFLQSILRQKESLLVALARSVLFPALFVFTLPALLSSTPLHAETGVYIAVPISDVLTACVTKRYMSKRTEAGSPDVKRKSD